MNLRSKIYTVIILAWLIILVSITIVSYSLMLTDYAYIEKNSIADQHNRVVEALSRARESLNAIVVDWAHWDDTYQFIKDKNKKYIEDNLYTLTVYKDLKINYVLFFNNDGNYFYGTGYDLNTNQFVPVPQTLIEQIIQHKSLILKHSKIRDVTNGYLLTKEGHLVYSSFAITDSKTQATPNGNIVMAYYLDNNRIGLLSKTLGFKVELFPLDIFSNTKINTSLSKGIEYYALPRSNEIMDVYMYLSNLNTPIGILHIELPRRIYAQGLKTMKNYILISGLIGILIGVIFEFMIKYFILNRLHSYKEQLSDITHTQDFTKKIQIGGSDEISNMASSSNNLLSVINNAHQQLEKTIEKLKNKNSRLNQEIIEHNKEKEKVANLNKQLLSTARLGGMAEVATSVLHNVGNILNSVNVSSQLLYEVLVNSKIVDGLKEINNVLHDSSQELTQEISKTKFGQELLNYLKSLENALQNEKTNAGQELTNILKNVQHIRDVVMAQQMYGGRYGIIESISLAEQIDLAINIVGFTDSYHIQKFYNYREPISTDKTKLMQILVNILRNSKDSLAESKRRDKDIKIILNEASKTEICIQIIDNGTGIDKDNLDKLFTFGFTTKEKGHGYGLHSSALCVREIGGKIVATSDGANFGACFAIYLPKQFTSN